MNRKYNTTTEAEIRRLVGEGLKFPAIAERLGVYLPMLRATASILGIKSAAKNGNRSSGSAREYLVGVARGETLDAIGTRYGTTASNVRKTLKSAGLPTCARVYLKAVADGSIAPVAKV